MHYQAELGYDIRTLLSDRGYDDLQPFAAHADRRAAYFTAKRLGRPVFLKAFPFGDGFFFADQELARVSLGHPCHPDLVECIRYERQPLILIFPYYRPLTDELPAPNHSIAVRVAMLMGAALGFAALVGFYWERRDPLLYVDLDDECLRLRSDGSLVVVDHADVLPVQRLRSFWRLYRRVPTKPDFLPPEVRRVGSPARFFQASTMDSRYSMHQLGTFITRALQWNAAESVYREALLDRGLIPESAYKALERLIGHLDAPFEMRLPWAQTAERATAVLCALQPILRNAGSSPDSPVLRCVSRLHRDADPRVRALAHRIQAALL